ncbi:MAG: hypothetical protein QW474_01140 [Candidatus Aenigmatarchaeota archaeon]
MKYRKNPIAKDFFSALMPYLYLTGIGILIYINRKKIFKSITEQITGKSTEEFKKDIETIKKASAKEYAQAIWYAIKEPKVQSQEWWKNQQWITDFKKGWKTKEQILAEAKKLGYNISPELAKLLKI